MCSCVVFDHEFHHNIVKASVDPRGDSRSSGSADYSDNVMTKFIVHTRTDARKADVHLFVMINCQIVRSRSVPHRINYKLVCLSAY